MKSSTQYSKWKAAVLAFHESEQTLWGWRGSLKQKSLSPLTQAASSYHRHKWHPWALFCRVPFLAVSHETPLCIRIGSCRCKAVWMPPHKHSLHLSGVDTRLPMVVCTQTREPSGAHSLPARHHTSTLPCKPTPAPASNWCKYLATHLVVYLLSSTWLQGRKLFLVCFSIMQYLSSNLGFKLFQ